MFNLSFVNDRTFVTTTLFKSTTSESVAHQIEKCSFRVALQFKPIVENVSLDLGAVGKFNYHEDTKDPVY